MKVFLSSIFLASLTTLTDGSTELSLIFQRQTGIMQTTNTNATYNSRSIEFSFEPKQSAGFPMIQWTLGIGSGSTEQTEFDPGPNYSIRKVQPSTYLSSGIRFQSPGKINLGFGFEIRLRGDQLKGGSGYNKERQNAVEGILLLYGKGLLSIPNSSLKVVLGAHYGFIATNYPYPNREIAVFSGIRF